MALQDTLPTGWSGYNPQQKIDYFNQQGITPAQLTAAGVPQSDITWMQGQGYTGGAAAPAPAPAPTTAPDARAIPASDNVGFTPPEGMATQAFEPWQNLRTGQQYTTSTGGYKPPSKDWVQSNSWSGYTPQQKMDYFKTQGITAQELEAAGASKADLDWMKSQGFGSTTASAPTGTGFSAQPGSTLPAYSQVNQQQGVAGYAQPYVGAMLGATMGQLFNTDQSGNITGFKGYTPYSYNPSDYFAAFSPLQQQAFRSAGQMQTPGQYGMGTQAANAGILGALSAGSRYGQMVTDPYATAAFMSPYYQNVVDTQMQQAKRQADIAAQTQQAQAVKAGAFGGGRDLIQRQQANAELQRNLQNIQATGTQNAYAQALQNIQNVSNLGLQGAQAGITGAGALGQLGAGQLAAQQGIANLQNQFGGQQQKQQQDIINQGVQNYQTAQQYPYMQLGFMQNMLQGLPITTQAQQTYQQPPSTLSQLAGAGTALYGLDKLTGGGIADIAKTGWNWLTGSGNGKEGGTTEAIQNRAPAGLAELAISKM